MKTHLALPVLLATVLLLGGCAAQMEHSKGVDLVAKGQAADGVESLRRAASLAPDNVNFRMDYLTERDRAVQRLVQAAEADRAAGRSDAAAAKLREALRVDNGNERARQALQALDQDRRDQQAVLAAERLAQAGQFEPALEILQRTLRESPRSAPAQALVRQIEERMTQDRQAREETLAARAAFRRPVTLQFRDAPLRMVFEAISKIGNVNVIVDREVKVDQKATIFVKDAAIDDALDVVLLQHQLEKRVLSSNTLLIYPATAAKQKELAELKVRTFQVQNVDVAFMANLIKTMVKTRDIVTDAKSGTLVMRDTPEAIALAERLMAANDLPDPEVMLEVEVLEVSSSRTSEIGLKLPGSVSLSVPTPASGALTLGALGDLTRNALQVSPLSATLNLMLQDGDATVLASPRIRSRNKEKAKILVGDKLPIITNLISPQQSGSSNVVTGSIQYVEVGIKLEVEPQVYGDGDVGIKMNLEVSNVTDTIQTESGRAYQIGTRSAQTTLRLRDGETQVMAGLINDSDRNSALKVPGIGQLPVLGRLFTNQSDNNRKTEIVLSITPRIIRPTAVPDLRNADAWSGTEAGVRDRALRLEPVSVVKATTPRVAPGAVQPQPTGRPAAVVAPVEPAPEGGAPTTSADPAAPAPVPAPTTAPPPASASAPTALTVPRPAATPAATLPAPGMVNATAGPAPTIVRPALTPVPVTPAAASNGMPGLPQVLPRPMPNRAAASASQPQGSQ